MNLVFDLARNRSAVEFALTAKANPTPLFTVAGSYKPSALAEFCETLVFQLDRHVQVLVRKIGILLLTPNLLEKQLKACSAAKGTEPPLDSIYSSLRHRYPQLRRSRRNREVATALSSPTVLASRKPTPQGTSGNSEPPSSLL
jgi:hypothetical protein